MSFGPHLASASCQLGIFAAQRQERVTKDDRGDWDGGVNVNLNITDTLQLNIFKKSEINALSGIYWKMFSCQVQNLLQPMHPSGCRVELGFVSLLCMELTHSSSQSVVSAGEEESFPSKQTTTFEAEELHAEPPSSS